MGAAVAFGPKHSNSMEALIMLEQKLATTVKNSSEFQNWLFDILGNQELCDQLGRSSKEFVETQAGAAKICIPFLMDGLS
jgi:3-deoxy-D-manno-octulosonic-acid transferase